MQPSPPPPSPPPPPPPPQAPPLTLKQQGLHIHPIGNRPDRALPVAAHANKVGALKHVPYGTLIPNRCHVMSDVRSPSKYTVRTYMQSSQKKQTTLNTPVIHSFIHSSMHPFVQRGFVSWNRKRRGWLAGWLHTYIHATYPCSFT